MNKNQPKTAASSSFKGDLAKKLRILEQRFQNRESAAKAAGVSKGAFETWVYGRSVPSFEALASLSNATGVSLDWIAHGTTDDPDVQQQFVKVIDREQMKIDYMLIDEINRKLREMHAKFPDNDEIELAPAPYTMYWTYNDLIVIQDEAERARTLNTIVSTYERALIEVDDKRKQAEQETPDDKLQA